MLLCWESTVWVDRPGASNRMISTSCGTTTFPAPLAPDSMPSKPRCGCSTFACLLHSWGLALRLPSTAAPLPCLPDRTARFHVRIPCSCTEYGALLPCCTTSSMCPLRLADISSAGGSRQAARLAPAWIEKTSLPAIGEVCRAVREGESSGLLWWELPGWGS